MFTKNAVGVIDRLRVKAESNGDGTVGFDFITIITAVTTLLPLLQGLFANCNKKPPAPTPVPPAYRQWGYQQKHGIKRQTQNGSLLMHGMVINIDRTS